MCLNVTFKWYLARLASTTHSGNSRGLICRAKLRPESRHVAIFRCQMLSKWGVYVEAGKLKWIHLVPHLRFTLKIAITILNIPKHTNYLLRFRIPRIRLSQVNRVQGSLSCDPRRVVWPDAHCAPEYTSDPSWYCPQVVTWIPVYIYRSTHHTEPLVPHSYVLIAIRFPSTICHNSP